MQRDKTCYFRLNIQTYVHLGKSVLAFSWPMFIDPRLYQPRVLLFTCDKHCQHTETTTNMGKNILGSNRVEQQSIKNILNFSTLLHKFTRIRLLRKE